MDKKNEKALLMMNDIIKGYLNGEYDRCEAVDKLVFIDLDVIHCLNSEFMVTDCYYTIKHLTETGYETTDLELVYFRDCIDGIKNYDLNEKNAYLRSGYSRL
jgi:hypothetical protein